MTVCPGLYKSVMCPLGYPDLYLKTLLTVDNHEYHIFLVSFLRVFEVDIGAFKWLIFIYMWSVLLFLFIFAQ